MASEHAQPLLTVVEVAEQLRVSASEVTKLCKQGELAYLPGSPVRVPASEVRDYVLRNLVRRPAPQGKRSLTPEQQAERIVAEMRANGSWAKVTAADRFLISQRRKPRDGAA